MNEEDQDQEPREESGPTEEPDKPERKDEESTDPNLRAAVGGYRKKRRIGWYLALLLLGFGLGAALALVVGQTIGDTADVQPPSPPASGQKASGDFSGLVFSADSEAPSETPDMFEAGISQIYCHFRLSDVQSIEKLSGECYRDGELLVELPKEDFAGDIENGVAVGHAILEPPGDEGFGPGIYELTVTTGEGDEHSASFVVVEDAEKLEKPRTENVTVSEVTVCKNIAEDGSPVEAVDRLSADTDRIYVAFRYQGADPGATIEVLWNVEETALPESPQSVTLPSNSGWAHAWISAGQEELLPTGRYEVIVRPDPGNAPLGTANFQITPK